MRGGLVEPKEPNALKFERFIFDLLPHAKNALVVEFAEADVFAPLKNAPGAAARYARVRAAVHDRASTANGWKRPAREWQKAWR